MLRQHQTSTKCLHHLCPTNYDFQPLQSLPQNTTGIGFFLTKLSHFEQFWPNLVHGMRNLNAHKAPLLKTRRKLNYLFSGASTCARHIDSPSASAPVAPSLPTIPSSASSSRTLSARTSAASRGEMTKRAQCTLEWSVCAGPSAGSRSRRGRSGRRFVVYDSWFAVCGLWFVGPMGAFFL